MTPVFGVTAGIVEAWLADHENDADAVAAGFDPGPVGEETPEWIETSEALGERLVTAFLEFAEGAPTRG